MQKRKYILLSLFIGLTALAFYLLWPLSSEQFIINWDQDLMAFKNRFLLFQPVAHKAPDKPNIILIMVDDLGKTDISLYGKGKVSTPHIDQLGSEGVVFEQAYATSPVCSPSRASILTGRYPQRYGFVYQIHEFYTANRLEYFGFKYLVDSYPWMPHDLNPVPSEEMAEKQGLPPTEITLPELLKKQGYTTALVGKWHLGYHDQNVPCNFGFDYQYGFYASHSLYAPEDDPGIVSQKIKNDFSDSHIWKGQREGIHAIYRNCEEIEEKEYLTNAITRECKKFIRANADTSFFLIASYNAPHTPLQAPSAYVDKFKQVDDPVKRVYYAMIASLDDAIGELNAYLKELHIDRNTMVFFISDNGGATYTHTTDNHPLKGGKITDFEGGINVPFIMKWPDGLPSAVRYDHPVSSMDIFGTVTSVLETRMPEDRAYDGVNLIPFIIDSTKVDLPHEYLYWYRGNARAIRSRDWKLVWNPKFNEKALFNMTGNNLERQDVLSRHTDVAKDLENEFNRWVLDMDPALWPPLVYFEYEEDGRTYHFDN